MPRLVLPKSAVKDVKLLLSLDVELLRRLDDFFSTAESITPNIAELAIELSKKPGLELPAAETVVMVCQYLLSVVGDGYKPEELVNDLVAFVARNAPEDKQFLVTVDKKRPALTSLLTPKPERRRAMKVEYLAHGPQQTVDSFRTICDVRPVFESVDGEEKIAGYVPRVLLEAKISDPDGDGRQTILLYMTTKRLASLKEIVERTEAKLNAIRTTFGNDLLHD